RVSVAGSLAPSGRGCGVSRAAVVGAGTMCNGIAHVFAQAGWDVMLVDVSREALDKALETSRGNSERQVKKATLTKDQQQALLGRVTTNTSLVGIAGAELVVEAATENREVKFRLFGDIDQHATAGALLAT